MKVFLCEHIHPEALELLKSRAEIIDDFERIGEVDAIVNRNLRLPRELLQRAPRLKVIAVHGTGQDGIDMAWCDEKGVTVLYVPYQNSDSVAELIVTLTLNLLRKIHLADRMVLSGELKETAPQALFGHELAGKTLGLIGVGDIAKRAARIMQNGFGVRVVGYAPPFTEEEARTLGIVRCGSVREVIAQADIISLGVHLTPETENLIGREELALARPGAMLINTARGGVVDEQALYEALTTGRLAGAACDVWRDEPPTPANPLVGLPNVLATPHLGANTEEALRRVGVNMVRQIFDVLDGKPAAYVYHA